MKLTMPLKRIHFVGIGGIGMSAIAEMLEDLGVEVQGSDQSENANVLRVREKGIPVFIGHDKAHLKNADAVVYSTATKEDNPELVEARRRGLPVGHRSEMLAEILHYKQSICVSGTHGKTTTSSLIASILMAAKMRPSFVIGGILNSQASNARLGKGDYVVAEADESDGSFLKLPTTISVVTNVDPEHMDFYHTFDNMKKAYELFINNTSFYGFSVVCIDHPVVREIAEKITTRRLVTYGMAKSADVHADNIRFGDGCIVFDVFVRNGEKFKKMKDVRLSMLGRHNVQNALAAIAVGWKLGIKETVIKRALRSFEGIQRRLTLRGVVNDVRIYDDYAHHPTEIEATLSAVREAAKGKVVAVFQPHRYSRFADLWESFLTAFELADKVVVCDVYGAGEDPVDGISGARFANILARTHADVHYMPGFDTFADTVKQLTEPKDMVVCLGAGTISAQTVQMVKELKGKKK